MSAVRIMPPQQTVYQFKRAARVPHGVTAEGVVDERARIIERFGRATARESAEAVMAAPSEFPNLRAWAPDDAESALRLCVEAGVRRAFQSIVQIDTLPGRGDGDRQVEVRVFHAVPVNGADDLSYEEITVIREDKEQKSFLMSQLRRDARAFSEKLETVLAELETLI